MQHGEAEFERIFESGKYLDLLELSDSNLRTEDGCNFAIHRVILARSSDYFRRMFLGMGKRRRKFRIPGISGECLSDILRYAYTGDVRITKRNIADLIIGADYLLFEDLQMEIKKFNIEDCLTEDNCLRVLHAAHKIGDEDIFRVCFRFIQMRFEGIMRCEKDDLADLPLDLLGKILNNRSLCVYNETTVWQAIVAWTQKDIPLRMSCVTQLLLTLATEDMGEELATEILRHEIVSENCFMKDLVEITSSNDFDSSLGVLLTFFRSYRFTEPIVRHRIPHKLLVFRCKGIGHGRLCVTYDENTDFYRHLTDMRQPILDALLAVGHNIYSFEMSARLCMKYDLSTMNWVEMKRFKNSYDNRKLSIVAVGAYIFVLGRTRRLRNYRVEVYDTANDRWRKGVPPPNISNAEAVAFENKIYVVGNAENPGNAMMTQMFDPDTQQWSILPPPTVYTSTFSLVAYHQKIYLVGRSTDQVFDPATNLWKELPRALRNPKLDWWSLKAVVINDQIIAYDTLRHDDPYMRWNSSKECWEKLDPNLCLNRLSSRCSTFCTVDDVESIRMITSQTRDPETEMKKMRSI